MKAWRTLVGVVIICVAVTGAAGIYWYLYLSPIVLRLAVAPTGSEAANFFAAFARVSEAEKLRVRLVLAPLTNLAETSAAIDAGDVDLAIARADYRLPATGLAVASLHQNIVILAACNPIAAQPPPARRGAPPAAVRPASIQGFADLRGRRVGVLGRGPANRALFARLAAYHGLAAGDVTIVTFTEVADIATQTRSQPLDGIFVSAPRGDQLIGSVLSAMACPEGRSLAIVPLAEGSVFQARNRIFASVEIVAAEFAANPSLPADAMSTLAFSSILVARRGLADDVVEEFTKQLFTLRHGLISQYPAAARIEALPTDRGSAFTLHPGAATYYDAEAKSFFERYETLIYILLFGFSGILSGFIWIWRSLFPTRRLLVHEEHHAFEALVGRARHARSPEVLDVLVAEADALLATLSANMLDGRIDLELKPAFDILTERLDTAIAQRRVVLSQSPPAAAVGAEGQADGQPPDPGSRA
ncbi:TAXI family TRAP transporter solute-binding subunit [Phreatobacter sp.]|uniref:TAXI family TRAP transporter solute-binding subunit n=1 Tax=Phreatobacter sp. TaxID=1966341 RepID=UPI003F72AD11